MLYRYHGRELQLLLPNGMRIATGRAHLAYGYIVFSSFVSRFSFQNAPSVGQTQIAICTTQVECVTRGAEMLKFC